MPSFYERAKNYIYRNRTPLLAVPAVIGGTYLVGNYVISKLNETRQKLSDDRLARDNLRRRFAQNQEDCTYTVLALLPTATENICNELDVERLTGELQARRAVRGGGAAGPGSVASSDFVTSEAPSSTANAGQGNSLEGSTSANGFIHASQVQGSEGAASENAGGEASQASQPQRPAKSKLQLWEEVKIVALTRVITLVYTLALLTLFTRIQLNLLGRRNYLSSVVALATPAQSISLENREDADADAAQNYGDDFDTNRMYLTFSWWLLHRGWKNLRTKVEAAVNDVFSTMSPRDNVSYARFTEAVKEVRMRVEGATAAERRESKWLEYLLPGSEDEQTVLKESGIVPNAEVAADGGENNQHIEVTSSLRRLLDETSDIVESPTFAHVLTETLDAGFELLVEDKVAKEGFKIPSQTGHAAEIVPDQSWMQSGRIEEVEEAAEESILNSAEYVRQTKCRLATVLAVVTKQAHTIGSGGNLTSMMAASSSSTWEMPGVAAAGNMNSLREANEYLAAIEKVRDVEAFAAVIYSSNFELGDTGEAGDDDDREVKQSLNLREVEQSLVDVGKDVGQSLETAWSRAASQIPPSAAP